MAEAGARSVRYEAPMDGRRISAGSLTDRRRARCGPGPRRRQREFDPGPAVRGRRSTGGSGVAVGVSDPAPGGLGSLLGFHGRGGRRP